MYPDVARVKFDREVANLAAQGEAFRRRGAFLLQVDYPRVVVVFAPPKLKPAPMIFAMMADYTDYDLQPPSIQFVDPFTYEPLTAAQLPTKMMRSIPHPPGQLNVPDLPAGAVVAQGNAQLEVAANGLGPMGFPWLSVPVVEHQALLQDYGPDTIPFLCIAGVREYHQHPGHSGDPWELHRLTGAGSLVRLVGIVLAYAVEPVAGWAINMVPQLAIGYSPEPPE